MTSGIYHIVNRVNDKRYIGSSVDIEHRFIDHKHRLRLRKHHSIVLQRAWDKYGEDNFEFRIIELCKPEDLIVREQQHIDCCPIGQTYNISMIANSRLGVKNSAESRKKMSLSQTGRIIPPEVRLKISRANSGKGHPHTPETKARMSAMKKGKPLTYKQVGKPIRQIDLQTGEILQLFQTISEAAHRTATDRRAIQRVLNGNWNKAGGYKWEYHEN